MSLAALFEAARSRNEVALIPYLTAGYPDIRRSLDLLDVAEGAGADAVEIGIPFSDPVADGPTIQASSFEALEAGFKTRDFLRELAAKKARAPRIVMTYLNPLLALGADAFPLLQAASVTGLVVPDLPEEEAHALSSEAAASGVDLVLLASPTSSDLRLRRIGASSRGFVYVVGVVGTTGSRSAADPQLPGILSRVRAATALPLVTGFGLSEPAHIEAIRDYTDGAIVGSRLVEGIRRGEDFGALIRSFKRATRRH